MGFGEKRILLIYFISLSSFLFGFRKFILQTNYIILLLAFGFFGASLSVDMDIISLSAPESSPRNLNYLVEDGGKFLGIVSWCFYFANTSFHNILKINAEAKNH